MRDRAYKGKEAAGHEALGPSSRGIRIETVTQSPGAELALLVPILGHTGQYYGISNWHPVINMDIHGRVAYQQLVAPGGP